MIKNRTHDRASCFPLQIQRNAMGRNQGQLDNMERERQGPSAAKAREWNKRTSTASPAALPVGVYGT